MKLFDEDGNYVGEFIKDSIEEVKDNAVDKISNGELFLGLIVLLFVFPGWTIFGLVIYLICKIISFVIKLSINIVWWLIRLPFTLIISRELPEF